MGVMNREIEHLKNSFEFLEDEDKIPVSHNEASSHLVFDALVTLERKDRWVKDRHVTSNLEQSAFAAVFSKESDRIALTHAALNDLPTCAYNTQNAFFQFPSSEKQYVVCGLEIMQESAGKHAIIVRCSCRGKSSGTDYWIHSRSTMEDLCFSSYKAIPDVWLWTSLKHN